MRKLIIALVAALSLLGLSAHAKYIETHNNFVNLDLVETMVYQKQDREHPVAKLEVNTAKHTYVFEGRQAELIWLQAR